MEENKNYKTLLDNGIYSIQDGKYSDAIEYLDESIKLKNDFEISYFYRAVAYHAKENLNEAMLDYTKAIKLNPKMTDAYYNRAKIILEKKDSTKDEIEKAIDDLTRALELDEKFIDALYAISCAYKKVEQYHKALECLNKLLDIAPDSVHARALKKLILQKYIV